MSNSMKILIENLSTIDADKCNDEFFETLDELIIIATSVASKQVEKSGRKKRRLTFSSTSSTDEVICVSVPIDTVELSDSDESIHSIPSTSAQSPSAFVKEVRVTLKRWNAESLETKACSVKLKRIDMTGSSSTIQELNGPSIAANNRQHVEHETKEKPSFQVSLNEHENRNISEVNMGCIGNYTYDDYRQRYRDVCSTQ